MLSPFTQPSVIRRSLAVFILLAFAVQVAGSEGLQISLPPVRVRNKSGLQLAIDGRGVDANGYRPVKITVNPRGMKPLTADRQIRIVLKPHAYSNVATPSVSQIIDLPEGSTTTTAIVSMPQTALWHNLTLETYEGNEKLLDLSQEYLGWPRTTYWE